MIWCSVTGKWEKKIWSSLLPHSMDQGQYFTSNEQPTTSWEEGKGRGGFQWNRRMGNGTAINQVPLNAIYSHENGQSLFYNKKYNTQSNLKMKITMSVSSRTTKRPHTRIRKTQPTPSITYWAYITSVILFVQLKFHIYAIKKKRYKTTHRCNFFDIYKHLCTKGKRY